MVKIAYILLCHKDPAGIIAQAERLTASGDFVTIHLDGRAKAADYKRIRTALDSNASVAFARKRIKCGWGEWSLVEATLQALYVAEATFPTATHFYMLSGDCMPIKTAQYAHEFLAKDYVDYIESFDFFESGWIKTGIREERLIYRHWFNERTQKKLFYTSLELQQKYGLKREIPANLSIQIGSQWWCLRRSTIESILSFLNKNKKVVQFFKTTWIPDETFFQTLVPHLVPKKEIRTRPLTFLMFSDYGMPVIFYNDHYDLLLSQDYLFARKISIDALELKNKLGDLYNQKDVTFEISNEGRKLYDFISNRGRVGRRGATRFWEQEASIGRDRVLRLVACKKWHVAKRLVDRFHALSGGAVLHHVFNEEACDLPDLGGVETSLEKRDRQRRTLLRMCYEYLQTNELSICVDPASLDVIRDLYSDTAHIRILEVVCDFSDAYLLGHAYRIGLVSENSSATTVARLMPIIRSEVAFESQALQSENFKHFSQIDQRKDIEENTDVLMKFFDLPQEKAYELMTTDYLFVD